MATKKQGSVKATDTVLVTSVNLAADVGATILPVANGGTGSGSFTDGQLLIGSTTGNTLVKATLTGTANQVIVTNGGGSITLSTPQSIATASTPQFAKIGLNAAAHATARLYVTDSSSNVLLVETTGSTSQAGLKCSLKNGSTGIRDFTFSVRGDLDANGTFNISDETVGAIRLSCDQHGWFGFGDTGLSRLHAIENSSTASERGIISEQFLNSTAAGTFIGRKARVSGASRIALTVNDILAEYKSQGHDGTSFVDAAKIQVVAVGTIGTGRMPTDMVFYTSTDVSTSVVTEVMRLTAGGAVLAKGAGGLGYGTGAGGTVTQTTSKATGVTLSKATGQITLNNAALASDTTVSFTLTNTVIAATDVLVMNHVSGGTAGSYLLNAQCAAGSASINVRNITPGSLTEAIVIQFVVIKGVTS